MEANELLELEYMAEERKRGLLLAAAVISAAYANAGREISLDDCVKQAFALYERIQRRME